MACVLKCLGLAATGDGPVGQYLAAFDPEAHDGGGEATFTAHLADAFHFPTVAAAYQCYGTVPRARPLRADGKPNRPLTTFTMEFVTVPDDTED